jgi:hypothetical protein
MSGVDLRKLTDKTLVRALKELVHPRMDLSSEQIAEVVDRINTLEAVIRVLAYKGRTVHPLPSDLLVNESRFRASKMLKTYKPY